MLRREDGVGRRWSITYGELRLYLPSKVSRGQVLFARGLPPALSEAGGVRAAGGTAGRTAEGRGSACSLQLQEPHLLSRALPRKPPHQAAQETWANPVSVTCYVDSGSPEGRDLECLTMYSTYLWFQQHLHTVHTTDTLYEIYL